MVDCCVGLADCCVGFLLDDHLGLLYSYVELVCWFSELKLCPVLLCYECGCSVLILCCVCVL